MKSILILFSFALLTVGAGSTALASEVCEGKDMQTCYELGVLAHENGDFFTAAKHYRKTCYGDLEEACRAVEGHSKGTLELLEKMYRTSVLSRTLGAVVLEDMHGGEMTGDEIDAYFVRGIWEADRKVCDRGDMTMCFFLVPFEDRAAMEDPETMATVDGEDACFSPGFGIQVCPVNPPKKYEWEDAFQSAINLN